MNDLLPLLAQLVEDHGAAPFLDRPILDGNVLLSSQAWDGTMATLGRMLHAVLAYAGMHQELELVDARAPLTSPRYLETSQPRFVFVSGSASHLVFQVERMGAANPMLGVVCHEVARAFLATAGAAHPFRDGETSPDDIDGVRCGVAEVYLGFGLVATATAMTVHRVTEIRGNSARTTTARVVVGQLPTHELAYLLAVQLAVRDREAESQTVLAQLTHGQAEAVESARKDLERADLVARLHLPAPAASVLDLAMTAPSLAQVEAWRALDRHFAEPNRGKAVRRFYEKPVGGVVAVFMGTIIIVIIGLVASLDWKLIVLAVFGGLLGAIFVPVKRREYCGACWRILPKHEKIETCPKCGGTLRPAQPMSQRSQILDEDNEDDELTRAALASPPPDAAADHDART